MAGLLDFLAGSSDPSTADPTTGLVESQQRQLIAGILGQAGGALMAAGQPHFPGQNAQYLAQLGNIPGNVQTQMAQMGQLNKSNQQAIAEKRKNDQQAEMMKYTQTPEFQQQFDSLPPQLKALTTARLKSGDIAGALNDIKEARAQTQPIPLGGGNIGYRQADGGYLILNPQTNIQMRIGPDGKPVGNSAYGTGAPVDPSDMQPNPETGLRDQWLAKQGKDPAYVARLQRVARGDEQFPAQRDPMRTQLLNDLGMYAPDVNEQAYGNKKDMTKAINPGGDLYKRIIYPGQRTINHAAGLVDTIPMLNLDDGYYGTMGGNALKILNMKKQGGEQTRLINEAEQHLETVKSEWEKTLRGTGNMTDQSQRRLDNITLASGPSAIKGFLGWVNKGMQEQIEPLQTDYRKAMRNPRAGIKDIMGPNVEQNFAKLNAWTQPQAAQQTAEPPAQGSTTAPAPGQPNQAPGGGNLPAGLPPGSSFSHMTNRGKRVFNTPQGQVVEK